MVLSLLVDPIHNITSLWLHHYDNSGLLTGGPVGPGSPLRPADPGAPYNYNSNNLVHFYSIIKH